MTLPMLRRPNRMQRPEGAGQSRTTHLGMKTRTTQEKSEQMQIRARMSMSADGYVTTPAGWPAPTADPACVSGKSHGIQEFHKGCEAALMAAPRSSPHSPPKGG